MGATKDVMERAIKKAEGDDVVAYIPGRYEVMGPGGSQLVVDTLTDNVNRAISDIKAVLKKTDSILQTVAYNFTETGVFLFAGNNVDEVTETLILNDVDVWDINEEDDVIEVLVNPTSYGKTRDTLYSLGINEFNISEIQMIPNNKITLNDEDKEVFKRILDMFEDVQDVQEVYHNVIVNDE
jgi:transcriptional/translational regulatory protein YebC/TACO1